MPVLRMGKKFVIAVAATVFALEFVFGYYLAHIYGFMSGDASSRVANAFYVLYSRNPALANIGFVWGPLPSLLEMIPLLFNPFFPLLASSGIAAVLVSSLFAASSAAVLMRIALDYGLGKWRSLALVALYSLNPYIFYYGANGLTEVMFIYFIQAIVVHLALWLKDGNVRSLIVVSLALGLAFWMRYEAITLAAGVAMVIAVGIYRNKAEGSGRRYKWTKLEAAWIVVLTPFVFSVCCWIFYNYTIMGNGFYFLNSSYSNLGQAELIKSNPEFASLVGDPIAAAVFVMKKNAYFSLPLLAIVALRVAEKRLLRKDFLVLLILIVSLSAMQYGLLVKGSSAAWIRYFMYPLPVVAAWIPYELSQAKFRKTAFAGYAAAMLVSAWVLLAMMNNPAVASDEYEAFRRGKLYDEQQAGQAASRYLNENYPDSMTLTDSFSSFRIIMGSDRPRKFVITSDRDFRRMLEDPQGSAVELILVPNPQAVLTLDAVNREYPRLYEEGAPWATLLKQFDDYWRLYRVNHNVS
ncbi:hypothetical protein D7Z26_08430 [Cohnella endophytica]|uniref:Glycosyltransferase RgtA/B/C/D-like domain-containing protein n=1 Tax=Cohnella endophytica TaxID=2419778 RepID=A0A494Y3Z5_9BACL|nr:glycosyltransferase family 39 protein [Cohnella endophytica]RKP55231.1 hypothetical protein D7Z26_08430 [Cohnella endophytica]